MKKKTIALAVCVLGAAMALALTGCGASLDRDTTVQDMAISVPSTWAEEPNDANSETGGSVWYIDTDPDKDETEFDAILVSYEAVEPSDASTAEEAMTEKQAQYEEDFAITNWDIEDSDEFVIDGAKVTTYEYSFEKTIDHVTQKYEYRIAYLYSPTTHYVIQVYGDAVSLDDIIRSVEL